MLTILSKVLAVTFVFAVLTQQCYCESTADDKRKSSAEGEVAESAVPPSLSADSSNLKPAVVAAVPEVPSGVEPSARSIEGDTEVESEGRQHGIKIKKKKPKLKVKKSKKFLKKILPFLLIPLLIQAKLIPLFLFKLKLLALKAFGIGKLALFLIVVNVLYNALHGAQDVDQQYSKDVLANEHYGYTGGPEYGAWVNRRHFLQQP